MTQLIVDIVMQSIKHNIQHGHTLVNVNFVTLTDKHR